MVYNDRDAGSRAYSVLKRLFRPDLYVHFHCSCRCTLNINSCCTNASFMQKPFPFMRIPYTGPLPPPVIIPRNANTPSGAIVALSTFLSAPASPLLKSSSSVEPGGRQTVLLTGAGISVASGLADYRGVHGTYTLNKTYRPIFYNEFISSHEVRKRYWARSFLGWYNLYKAKPNDAHWAVKGLGEMGVVKSVITQSRHASPLPPPVPYLPLCLCQHDGVSKLE